MVHQVDFTRSDMAGRDFFFWGPRNRLVLPVVTVTWLFFFGRKNVGDFFRKSQVTVGRHCWDLCPDPESDKADKVTEVGWVGRWDHRNIQELELDGTGVIEGFQDMFPFWVLVDNLRDKSLSLLLCMSRMLFFFFLISFFRGLIYHILPLCIIAAIALFMVADLKHFAALVSCWIDCRDCWALTSLNSCCHHMDVVYNHLQW